MADSERRYAPTIDLQGFDLRMDTDAVHEPSRLPLIVMIALVVLAAFAGVVWLAYTQGVERGRESVSRELTSQQFWKPREPAQTAYTGLKIYEPPSAVDQNSRENVTAASRPKVANAVPALRPTASAAPDALPIPGIATADQVRRPAAPPQGNRAAPDTTAAAGESAPRLATHAPTELTKPAAVAAMPTHPLTEPDSLAAAPAAAPSPPPAKKVTGAPRAPVTVSAPATTNAHAPVSGILLQIGSYKSDAEARASWQAFRSEHNAAGGYQPDVKQVDLGAKGTWYRLRMGPFPDKSSALEACRKLKADGASCLLAQ